QLAPTRRTTGRNWRRLGELTAAICGDSPNCYGSASTLNDPIVTWVLTRRCGGGHSPTQPRVEALSHHQEAPVNRSIRRTAPRVAMIAVSAVVLSLGLAACGGDDGDGGDSGDGGSADSPVEITI